MKNNIYKSFLINKCKFKIRKYNEESLIYSLSVVKENFKFLGNFKNPRDAINCAKEFAKIFD